MTDADLLDELAALPKELLSPKDVAKVLGCNPQTIRSQAQLDAKELGFPVSLIGKRTYIPKLAFLRWMHYPVTDELRQKSKLHTLTSSRSMILLADDIAEALGVSPSSLLEQARTNSAALGFPACVLDGSVRVGRIALMDWAGYYPADAQRRKPHVEKTAEVA